MAEPEGEKHLSEEHLNETDLQTAKYLVGAIKADLDEAERILLEAEGVMAEITRLIGLEALQRGLWQEASDDEAKPESSYINDVV